MQERPVLDSSGKSTGTYRYAGSVANRALQLLGRELGMFVERTMQVKDPIDFTPQEWDECLERYAATIGVPLDMLVKAAGELESHGPGKDSGRTN